MTDQISDPIKMLGERLKQVREKRGLSQTEMARRIGVVKQTISAWETGTSPPMVSNLIRFAAVTEVDLADLFRGLSEDLDQAAPVYKRLAASSKLIRCFGDEASGGQFIMGMPAREPEKYIATMTSHSEDDIAITVTGRAMLDRFKIGDMVTLRVNAIPEPDQFVFAFASGKFVFRRWVPVEHNTLIGSKLVALNTSYPPIIMTAEDKILAVMGEHTSSRHD